MRALTAGAALLLGLGLAAAPARAQGNPYVRESLGPLSERVSFGLRYEVETRDELWQGTSAAGRDESIAQEFASGGMHGELDLYSRTRAWIADTRVRFHDRFDATLTLPYVQRVHQHMLVHAPSFDPSFVDTWEYEGLGDATLLGHHRAFGSRDGASLALQGGMKLPTGRRHLPDEERTNGGLPSELHPSARPGSGSTDWLAGARWSQPLPWRAALPVTASLLARWNGKGTDDYRVGDELQAGVASGVSPVTWLDVLAQLHYAARGADESGHPGGEAHAGARALYATPGVNLRLAPTLTVYGLLRLRVWGETDEATVVAPRQFLLGTVLTPPR